ncbi:hypothetical protein WMF31_32490 [Sorangium sp. So ce1036]|uniref:hypothetical protein n=1 Tax=Sorangium sp. So ce1036 TaxID=3133328 RepID=UPI003F0E759E
MKGGVLDGTVAPISPFAGSFSAREVFSFRWLRQIDCPSHSPRLFPRPGFGAATPPVAFVAPP